MLGNMHRSMKYSVLILFALAVVHHIRDDSAVVYSLQGGKTIIAVRPMLAV